MKILRIIFSLFAKYFKRVINIYTIKNILFHGFMISLLIMVIDKYNGFSYAINKFDIYIIIVICISILLTFINIFKNLITKSINSVDRILIEVTIAQIVCLIYESILNCQ